MLDATPAKREHARMITQRFHLYVERTDASMNMARFYAISIEPDLFGEACLMRRWGRIGTKGQTMIQRFDTEREAVVQFLDLLQKKRQRGYSTISRNRHASDRACHEVKSSAR